LNPANSVFSSASSPSIGKYLQVASEIHALIRLNTDIPGPTPSIVGTLTNTGNVVSSTDLITNGHGNSSAEAANGNGTEGQQKKIGNMDVGPFAGLLVGLLILAIVGYLIGDRWVSELLYQSFTDADEYSAAQKEVRRLYATVALLHRQIPRPRS
jgi:hypothetical protein